MTVIIILPIGTPELLKSRLLRVCMNSLIDGLSCGVIADNESKIYALFVDEVQFEGI